MKMSVSYLCSRLLPLIISFRFLQYHRHARHPCLCRRRHQTLANFAQPSLPDREAVLSSVRSKTRLADPVRVDRLQIRSTTAEQLYLVLQTLESEASEELEETLLSTSWCVTSSLPRSNFSAKAGLSDLPLLRRSADDVSAETKTVCRLLREQLSTA